MKKEWYITPRMIVDDKKYRGRGRPRKSDYRIYPDKDRDFVEVNRPYVLVKEAKKWVGSVGSI